MLKIKKRNRHEIVVRVFLESELYGREFFDSNDSLEECTAAVTSLVASAIEQTQKDGMARQVGIAVVPKTEYGDPDGYGSGIDEAD